MITASVVGILGFSSLTLMASYDDWIDTSLTLLPALATIGCLLILIRLFRSGLSYRGALQKEYRVRRDVHQLDLLDKLRGLFERDAGRVRYVFTYINMPSEQDLQQGHEFGPIPSMIHIHMRERGTRKTLAKFEFSQELMRATVFVLRDHKDLIPRIEGAMMGLS
jgi:hypothetical protein